MARTPILVTGMHRSGTTWVGRILTASREAVYLHEPLNPLSAPHLLGLRIGRQYVYITEEDENGFPEAYRRLLGFPLGAARAERNAAQQLRRAVRLAHARVTGARALLKDPFAVFSIPWFARRLGAQVVVVVRRPEAVAGSAKRLGWGFDTRWVLGQPLLMRDRLEPYRAELEAQPDTLVGQSALLWKIVYGTVREDARELPQITLVRHEDLSREPLDGFRRLYGSLGLTFGERSRNAVERTTSASNPPETDLSVPGSVLVNSEANLESWKTRLTPEEVELVRAETDELAAELYS